MFFLMAEMASSKCYTGLIDHVWEHNASESILVEYCAILNVPGPNKFAIVVYPIDGFIIDVSLYYCTIYNTITAIRGYINCDCKMFSMIHCCFQSRESFSNYLISASCYESTINMSYLTGTRVSDTFFTHSVIIDANISRITNANFSRMTSKNPHSIIEIFSTSLSRLFFSNFHNLACKYLCVLGTENAYTNFDLSNIINTTNAYMFVPRDPIVLNKMQFSNNTYYYFSDYSLLNDHNIKNVITLTQCTFDIAIEKDTLMLLISSNINNISSFRLSDAFRCDTLYTKPLPIANNFQNYMIIILGILLCSLGFTLAYVKKKENAVKILEEHISIIEEINNDYG